MAEKERQPHCPFCQQVGRFSLSNDLEQINYDCLYLDTNNKQNENNDDSEQLKVKNFHFPLINELH